MSPDAAPVRRRERLQRRREVGNLTIKAVNSLQCGAQLFDQHQDLQATGGDDAHVFGEWYGRFDGIETSADQVRAPAVVGIEKGF